MSCQSRTGTGSLVATPVDDFLVGKRDLKLVMQPGPRETINGIEATHDYLRYRKGWLRASEGLTRPA